MDPRGLMRTPIVIEQRRAGSSEDDMGDPTNVITYVATKGFIWQDQRRDQSANTAVDFEQWRGALDPIIIGAIRSNDVLHEHATIDEDGNLVPGTATFEVYGPPYEATNPRTLGRPFVEVSLRRTR